LPLVSVIQNTRRNITAKVILLICCFAAGVSRLQAQTYNYRHYSVEHGLASTIAYMACQDSKGYIWFATEEGVSRFDGKAFVNFTMDDGLADNDILRIYADSQDRIWFFAFNGRMSFYQNGRIHNSRTDPWLKQLHSSSPFLHFHEDCRGRLWVGRYNNTVSVVQGETVHTIVLPAEHPDAGTFIQEDRSGRIFISYAGFIYDVDTVKYRAVVFNKIKGADDGRFFQGKSGNIYYYNRSGIFKSRYGKEEKISNYTEQLKHNKIVTITDDGSDIYAGTWNKGVFRFDSTFQYNDHARNYLPGIVVNSVFTDREGNIWFMTRYHGVYELPAQAAKVEVYRKPQLKDEQIYSIAIDDHNRIWLGCGENYLTCISRDTILNYNLVARHNSARLISLVKDKQGYIWGGGDNGVYKAVRHNPIQVIQAIPENIDSLHAMRVLNITFNNQNEGFITMPYHLLEIKENDKEKFRSLFKLNLLHRNIRNFFSYYDKSDRLYLADVNGLNILRNDSVIPVLPENELLRSRIISFSETEDSVLVAATDGSGLVFYKDRKVLLHITKNEGLLSNNCRRVFINGKRIYVCSNKGVSSFKYEASSISDFEYYNEFNGLVSNDSRDVYADRDHVYIATVGGLSVFRPGERETVSDPPPLYINRVLINDVATDRKSGIEINAGDKFSVEFVAVTFTNPAGIVYQYKLEDNVKTGWINLNDNRLDFYNMPAGEQKIRLRARKADSDWSAPVVVEVKVMPPFYRTWWFISSAALAGLIFISLLAGYFYRKKMRRQLAAIEKIQMLNTERTRISADMHDDLGSDFSRIAVLAELTRFSLADKPESQSLVKNISELVQSSRQKMDEIIWALNPSNDTTGDLIAYCNEYAYNYLSGSDIRVHLNTEQEIPDLLLNARQRRNIFLVIKEILNNVIKHSKAEDFYLTFGISDEILQIIASDNGQGFDQQQSSNRNGLKNICNRLNEIGGKADIVSSPGNGTSYVIHLNLMRS
jgi:signal transduction histidine kinase/ligand-binding sensor domain-containing protein